MGTYEGTERFRTPENDKADLRKAVCDECGDQAYTRWFEPTLMGKKRVVATLCQPCNVEFIADHHRRREEIFGAMASPSTEPKR